ncbi:MAG: hypothetical protein ACXWQZ_09495 [Ktedonobacterales bacterium]
MGMAFGAFIPAPEFETVRGVFGIIDQAVGEGATNERERLLAAYYQARDALGLTLETQEGTTIPTSWIHIAAVDPDQYEVEAQIADSSFFNGVLGKSE